MVNNENNPKLSIIVPVYNADKTLVTCVNSILNQTYKNLECILINDGSTDNSAVICDELEKKDCRVKVVHQKNAGVSVARNNGLRIATGEWIGFVDSDDYIEKEMYFVLLSNAKKYSVRISICGFSIVENNKKSTIRISNKKITSKKAIQNMKKKKYIAGGPCNKLFHKSIIENTFFPSNIHFGEDTFFLVEAFHKVQYVAITTSAFYVYIKNNTSLSHRKERDIVEYAYLMLNTYKNNDAFLTRYAKATICYIEYFYAVNNNAILKNTNYIIYMLFSSGFTLFTKCAIILYCISPSLYLKIKTKM
jgi:glycosyltransferase involved in cell wall biosynthesis